MIATLFLSFEEGTARADWDWWDSDGEADDSAGIALRVHGIISLVKHYRRRLRGPPPPSPDRERPEDRLGSLQLTLAPTRGGVYTGLYGRF